MTNLASGASPEELSKAEQLKVASHGLYGPIQEELADAAKPFSEDACNLLKHHGSYQQDNRDTRTARRKAGLDKEYTMMVRTKTPGGYLTAEQYLLCDDLCTKYGQDDLRITSRQGFQFHGVIKGNFRPLVHDLNKLQQITTQGACGDVCRNVTGCPVVDIDPMFEPYNTDILSICRTISTHLLPKSASYFDLWLNDEIVEIDEEGNVFYKEKGPKAPVEEPIYGRQYLPRKFKIGVTLDLDNSIDIYTNDLGIMGITENGGIKGWEILIGGGLGFNHSKEYTYPRLSSHLTFIQESELLRVVEAIVKYQRDYGNRADRQQARLKYTIDGMGMDEARRLIGEYAGMELPPPTNKKPVVQPDYLGWHQQKQAGLNYVGVWIENGRIRDFANSFQFKSGLRRIVDEFKPSVRLTSHHNIVLANIRDEDVAAVQAILDAHKIASDNITPLRRMEMACPALPLCGLALAEAERELPHLMEMLEARGHAQDNVVIRMTGCPNSCARPETAEIGIIGRGPNKYNLYTGGDRLGSRMNQLTGDTMTLDQIAAAICALLNEWKQSRAPEESFGDWCFSAGADQLKSVIDSGS